MNDPVSRRSALKLTAAASLSAFATRALAAPAKADTILTGGYVHTMNPGREFYRNGAVAIKDRLIVGVGPAHLIAERFTADSTVDASGKMMLPGFFDNHLHPSLTVPVRPPGEATAAARYPGVEGAFEKRPPGPFMPGGDFEANFKWLLPLSRYGYTEEESYYFALGTFMSAVSAGTTSYVDGGAGVTEAIVKAQLEVGLRGNVTGVAYDLLVDPAERSRGLQRVEDAQALLAEAERQHKQLHGLGDGLVHHWFSAFLDLTSSDELLSGMAKLARKHETGLYSHSGAGHTHDEYSRAHFGRATFDRLEALGVLGPNWLGVHMGYVAEADIPRLARHDCKITHCPGTSLFAGKGYISHSKVIPKFLQGGVAVSLGSDTANRGVVLVEAQRAFAAHKDAWQDNRVLPPYTIMRMLTSAGSQCALRPDCGTLEVGKRADLTIVDIDSQRYANDDPLAALLYVGYPSDVSATMVDGKFVYKDRQFTTIDAEKVRAEIRRIGQSRVDRQPRRPG